MYANYRLAKSKQEELLNLATKNSRRKALQAQIEMRNAYDISEENDALRPALQDYKHELQRIGKTEQMVAQARQQLMRQAGNQISAAMAELNNKPGGNHPAGGTQIPNYTIAQGQQVSLLRPMPTEALLKGAKDDAPAGDQQDWTERFRQALREKAGA